MEKQVKQVKPVKPHSSAAEEQLNSKDAFRLINFNWFIIGLSPPSRYRYLYYIYAVIVIIFGAILYPASMLINLYFVHNLQTVLANLGMSLTFVLATLKNLVVLIHRDRMKRTVQFLPSLDARCNQHPIDRSHIRAAIKVSHMFYTVFMSLYNSTGVGMAIIGYSQHQLVHSAWFPQLTHNTEINYLLAFSYQFIAQVYDICQNVYNDTYPPSYLAVMVAHLRALAGRIERIGKDPGQTLDDNQKELLKCMEDHKDIMGYFDSVSTVIGNTIFLQILVTAFSLCITAANLMLFDISFAEKLVTTMYVTALLTEIFPCCWYANAMMEESSKLTSAMYSCNWYDQDQNFRKTLIIFMQRSQVSNVILAGNIVPITLQTFIGIIKFSFSMFTLLQNMKEK